MTEILNREFDRNAIHEIDEYILDAIEDADIPQDEYGFIKGDIHVVVTFIPDGE
jgi:hypothetical protein